ncbi:MAG: caspase family protein [Deltaproteobacteria bacterium]|nr:caspase family protein [Deltaproteobacteria bacterium]
MKTIEQAFIFLMLPLFVFSCSSTKLVKKPPRFNIVEITLAKDVEDKGTFAIPVNPTTTFTTDDPQVVSFIEYENLSGRHTLRWEWYDPEGKLYQRTGNYPIRASRDKYIKQGAASHRISVKGNKAATLPGDWQVKVYLDNYLTARKSFRINEIRVAKKPPPIVPTGIDFGDYHALVIGNNEYNFLRKLKTAINDATEVGKLLKDDYGFQVTTLTDATRADILTALESFRAQLIENDNLLIYYAGHGWLDEEADEGYWLPVDATSDSTVNWLSNSAITSTLKAIAAKHVLVVADSCYSGKLARGLHIVKKSPHYLSRIAHKRARSVLCSGGLEPVIDSGGKGGHSVFASQFIQALRENKDIILGAELFTAIRRPVLLNADQSPEYADIRKAGHEGGDFLFVRQP